MAKEFSQCILTKVVAQICQMVGFEKIMTTPLLVLADILKEFILKLGRIAQQNGEHCGRSVINLRDLSLAFHVCGILPGELTEFLQLISPLPKSITVPKYPVTIKTVNTPNDSSDVDDLSEIENVQPDGGVNVNDIRETLKIKISLSKIKEACEAKKSKNKKTKQKRKKKKKNKNRLNKNSIGEV